MGFTTIAKQLRCGYKICHPAQGFQSVYKPQRTGAVQFAELLDAVASVDPEMRIRFTSPHPKEFSDDVLRVRSTSLAALGFPQYVHVCEGFLDYDYVSCTASGVKPSILAGTGITAMLSAVQGCNSMCSMSCWQVHVSLSTSIALHDCSCICIMLS